MRRAGVDHARMRIGDKRDRFLRRRIRQTQENNISRVEAGDLGGGVLALRRIDGDEFHIRAQHKPLVDLEAGGAFLTVNKDLGFHREAAISPHIARAASLRNVRSTVRSPQATAHARPREPWP